MTYLCQIDEVNANGKEVMLPGEPPVYLMLFHRRGELLAFHNVCPHAGRSLNWGPDQFLFSRDGLLVCPHHGASFDLDNGGICTAGPCPGAVLKPVALEVRDKQLFIKETS